MNKVIEFLTSKGFVYAMKAAGAVAAVLTAAFTSADAAKYRRENLKTPKE